MRNRALAWKDALSDVFPLIFKLPVDGGRQVLDPLYFSWSRFRSLIFELLEFRLDDEKHFLFIFLVHLLHFIHEGDVVVTVFLQQQHLNDINEVLQNLIYELL